MIHILKDPQIVSDIFSNEFNSTPPMPPQGEIVASVSNGRIDSFLLVEQLVRIGLLWVAPEHRNTTKSLRLTRELVHYVVPRIPTNTSVITIDEKDEFDKVFKHLGMRKVNGIIYRKDF